jgi:hypothetical protein
MYDIDVYEGGQSHGHGQVTYQTSKVQTENYMYTGIRANARLIAAIPICFKRAISWSLARRSPSTGAGFGPFWLCTIKSNDVYKYTKNQSVKSSPRDDAK